MANTLYSEDNLSVDRIKKMLVTFWWESDGEAWDELLPSFQRICVEWLVAECESLKAELDKKLESEDE